MNAFNQFAGQLIQDLKDALHRAVMAPTRKAQMPRWRNLGRAITPYHYLRPIPVRSQQTDSRKQA